MGGLRIPDTERLGGALHSEVYSLFALGRRFGVGVALTGQSKESSTTDAGRKKTLKLSNEASLMKRARKTGNPSMNNYTRIGGFGLGLCKVNKVGERGVCTQLPTQLGN